MTRTSAPAAAPRLCRARRPSAQASALALALLSFLFPPLLAPAQELREEVWMTDGPVYALASAGGVLYLGGEFDYVGRPPPARRRRDRPGRRR